MNHGLGRSVPVILENGPAVVPVSDTGVHLPLIGFKHQCARLADSEIVDHSAQHRAGNTLDIESAPVSLIPKSWTTVLNTELGTLLILSTASSLPAFRRMFAL